MRGFKKILVFLCLNLIAAGLMQFILQSPAEHRIRREEFTGGDYNNVIIGHSLLAAGLDSRQMQLDEGDRVYNFATSGEPFKNLYYLLRELDSSSELKRVYLDMCSLFWTDSHYSADHCSENRKLLNVLRGDRGLSYIFNELMDENYNSVLFPYKLSRRSVSGIPKTLRDKLNPGYLKKEPEMLSVFKGPEYFRYAGDGFLYCFRQKDPPYSFESFEAEEISPEAIEDFKKIAEYCAERDIELICVKSALPPVRLQNENHGEEHDFFAALCREQKLAFYDMNYVKFELFPRKYEDYRDTDGHMLGSTAGRQARLLMEIMGSESPEDFFENSYEEVLKGIEEYEKKHSAA